MFHAIYWFQPNPGPMTPRAWLFYLPFAFVFVAALGWSSWYLFIRQQKTAPNPLTRLAWFELAVGLLGLLLVAARPAMIPGWSARAWPMLMTILAAAGPLTLVLARHPSGSLNAALDLLALRQTGPPLIFRRQAALWLLHGLGLALWT